jgi:hypothetical protein
LVVMMMVAAAAAFTAVATPHALILTVSHVLQFHQPLFAFVELKLHRTSPAHRSHTARCHHGIGRNYSLSPNETLLAAALTTSFCRNASCPSP